MALPSLISCCHLFCHSADLVLSQALVFLSAFFRRLHIRAECWAQSELADDITPQNLLFLSWEEEQLHRPHPCHLRVVTDEGAKLSDIFVGFYPLVQTTWTRTVFDWLNAFSFLCVEEGRGHSVESKWVSTVKRGPDSCPVIRWLCLVKREISIWYN